MKNATAQKQSWLRNVSSVAVLLAVICGVGAATASGADAAAVKTFDMIIYTEPAGFEPAPLGNNNHVTFRRVETTSWILFSIYGGRAASKELAAEFAFDWRDLSGSAGGIPRSTARTVGAGIEAREGGVFVPGVGYVDLVDVRSRGHVAAILIECGSADQFRAYQPLIDTFLASLVAKGEARPESGGNTSSATTSTSTAATTHEIEFVKDDFVWTGANGLEYIPALTRVGAGAGFPASIPGIWQDDRQQFTLELAADGTYASAYGGGSASGSFQIHESGRWKADGTNLQLRPESATRFSRSRFDTRGETARVEFGGPRVYDVTTLALEYTRNNQAYRIDGIELNGQPAPWFYTPSGTFSMVLRRTGPPRTK